MIFSSERRRRAQTPAFPNEIKSLFAGGIGGEFYLPFPQFLFQDAAGTIPVTADGDPVRLMLDISGNGKHAQALSDAARPIYKTNGLLHWLEFDGIAHLLRASSSVAGIDDLTMCVVAEYNNPPAASAIVCYRNLTNTGTALLVRNAGNLFTFRASDSSVVDANAPSGYEGIPSTFMLTYQGTALRGRHNGSEVASTANTGLLVNSTGYLYIGGIDASTLQEIKFYGSANIHQTFSVAIRERIEYLMSKLRPSEAINVFLVAGQSNTDGRNASSGGPVWIQDDAVDGVRVWDSEKIIPYLLTDIGQDGNGSSWISSDSLSKFSFAHIALKAINDSIGQVVVCQVTSGGTPIAPTSNTNGSWCADYDAIPSGTPALLQELQSRFGFLMSHCAANNITPTIRALLWHQGESDVTRGEQANYGSRLTAVMTQIRQFSGVSDLPIYFGTIAFASGAYDTTVNTAMTNYAVGTTNAYCRDNYSLTLLDTFHFDATSSETFGTWVATEYLS